MIIQRNYCGCFAIMSNKRLPIRIVFDIFNKISECVQDMLSVKTRLFNYKVTLSQSVFGYKPLTYFTLSNEGNIATNRLIHYISLKRLQFQRDIYTL